MDESDRASLPSTWLRRLISKVAWYSLRSIRNVLVPIFQYVSIFLLMIVFSVLVYHLVNTTLLPKALISEPIYFDFAQSPPVARISMTSREKQWYYAATCLLDENESGKKKDAPTINDSADVSERSRVKYSTNTEACSGKGRNRFLRAGFRYSIDLKFNLATSSKNMNMGKFMVYAKVIDSAGDLVATSSRPVVVPYQSCVSLFLDSIVKYPLRIMGLLPIAEASDVFVTVMNEFREPSEPSRSKVPGVVLTSEFLELKLSSAEIDMNDAKITVMPMLSGLTWYLYYYPTTAWVIGVGSVTLLQLGFMVFLLLIRYMGRIMVSDSESDSDDSDDGELPPSSIPAPSAPISMRSVTQSPPMGRRIFTPHSVPVPVATIRSVPVSIPDSMSDPESVPVPPPQQSLPSQGILSSPSQRGSTFANASANAPLNVSDLSAPVSVPVSVSVPSESSLRRRFTRLPLGNVG